MVIPYMPMLVPPLNWTGYAALFFSLRKKLLCSVFCYECSCYAAFVVFLLYVMVHIMKTKAGPNLNNFWIVGRYERGAYLFLPSYIMRTHGAKQQREAVKRTPKEQLEPVYQVSHFGILDLVYCYILFSLMMT